MEKRGWEAYEEFGCFDTSFKIAADFENLLRLIYIHGIKMTYLPIDFVTMRTGGASTNGWNSRRRIVAEHLRAYRKNGVRSNRFLEAVRLACKGVGLMKYRMGL